MRRVSERQVKLWCSRYAERLAGRASVASGADPVHGSRIGRELACGATESTTKLEIDRPVAGEAVDVDVVRPSAGSEQRHLLVGGARRRTGRRTRRPGRRTGRGRPCRRRSRARTAPPRCRPGRRPCSASVSASATGCVDVELADRHAVGDRRDADEPGHRRSSSGSGRSPSVMSKSSEPLALASHVHLRRAR